MQSPDRKFFAGTGSTFGVPQQTSPLRTGLQGPLDQTMLQQHSGYDQQFQFRQMQNVAGSFSMMQPQGSGSDSGFHFEAAAFPVLSNSNRITGRPPIGSAQSSSTGIAHRSPQISGMSLPGEPPFSITGDDFPALSSSASSHSVGAISSAAQAAVRPPGFGKMPLGSESSPSGLSGMDSMYGLLGLLDVVRMTDKDLNVLSLGSDLTTFGLSLNSTDNLFSSFASPFLDQAASSEPQYTTPSCYTMHPLPMKADHIGKLQLESLFYMFYSMPRDLLQACAAQELYKRDWRYHGELRVWIRQRVLPHDQSPTSAAVQFAYFDVSAWEIKTLNTASIRGNITAGLLSEDEIRVKSVPPGPIGPRVPGSLS